MRQLTVSVGGRQLSLVDIGGSHSTACTSSSRLRKATQHFDGVAGVLFVVSLESLASPVEAAHIATLIPVLAALCGTDCPGEPGVPGQPRTLFLLISKMDLLPELLATGSLAETMPELQSSDGIGDGQEAAAEAARRLCVANVSPAMADRVQLVPPACLLDDYQVDVAFAAMVSIL